MASDANGKIVVPCWSDDGIVKAIVNDDGRIEVTLGESTVTLDVNLKSSDITLPTEEQSPLSSIEAQAYGWVSTAWQKQPILLGYSSVVRRYAIGIATGAGVTRAYTTAVPSDYLWVVTGYIVTHNDTAAKNVTMGVFDTVSHVGCDAYQAATPNIWYGGQCFQILRETEKFYGAFNASAINKTMQVWVTGYAVNIGA